MTLVCRFCMYAFHPVEGYQPFKDCPSCQNPLAEEYTLADEIISECNKGLPVHDLDKILRKHRLDVVYTPVGYQAMREEIMRWARKLTEGQRD